MSAPRARPRQGTRPHFNDYGAEFTLPAAHPAADTLPAVHPTATLLHSAGCLCQLPGSPTPWARARTPRACEAKENVTPVSTSSSSWSSRSRWFVPLDHPPPLPRSRPPPIGRPAWPLRPIAGRRAPRATLRRPRKKSHFVFTQITGRAERLANPLPPPTALHSVHWGTYCAVYEAFAPCAQYALGADCAQYA